jgi:hypothetical protein
MSKDKVITVMCAARLPEMLVLRIDKAAESGGVSRAQFIAEACRMYLDKGSAAQPDRAPAVGLKVDGSISSLSSNPSKMNDAMSAFISKLPAPMATPVEPEETDPLRSCSECDKAMISKLIKGRSWVHACSDKACPMYGIERK